jgi:RimJ/RimL family protein N-acetyltransferase
MVDATAYEAAAITFRFLTGPDLPMLLSWINSDHVAPWWNDGESTSLEEVTAHYGPRIDGQTTITAFIASYAGQPVGYLQRYFPHLEPDFWGNQTLPPGMAGVDLLIGDPRFVHRGFGPVMIRAFLRQIVFADKTVPGCLIDPDPTNTAAIRAYEKVGFRYLRTIGPPEHSDLAYLMTIDRAEVVEPTTKAGGVCHVGDG